MRYLVGETQEDQVVVHLVVEDMLIVDVGHARSRRLTQLGQQATCDLGEGTRGSSELSEHRRASRHETVDERHLHND